MNEATIYTATRRELYGAYFTVESIKAANRESGSHFFDADTMRFFGSRVLSPVFGGRFFVTSEQSGFDNNSPRAYTVREAMPDGSIESVGEFNEYETAAQAKAAAKRAAMIGHTYYVHPAGADHATVVDNAIDAWEAIEAVFADGCEPRELKWVGRISGERAEQMREHGHITIEGE